MVVVRLCYDVAISIMISCISEVANSKSEIVEIEFDVSSRILSSECENIKKTRKRGMDCLELLTVQYS
jgi:hypothetical protein